MAKYKEVHEKQRQLEELEERKGEKMGRGVFVGFTFRHRKPDGGQGAGVAAKKRAEEGAYGTIF